MAKRTTSFSKRWRSARDRRLDAAPIPVPCPVVNFGDQLIGVDGDDREGSQPLAGSRFLPVFSHIPPSPNG
jgi:hypothetical protein